MNIARKLGSVLTLAIAVIAFNSYVTAQNTSTDTDRNTVERNDKQGRFGRSDRRGMRNGKRGMRGGGNQGLMKMLSKLDLTETQKSQIKTLFEIRQNANQPLYSEGKTLMMKRRDGTITEDEQTRLGEIRDQMKTSNKQTKNSVLELLTPEQLQKLEQLRAEMKNRRQNKRQRSQQMTETEDN